MTEIKDFLRGDYLSPEMVAEGGVAEFVTEPKLIDGKFGEQLEGDIRLSTGVVKTYTINQTSAKKISDSFGTETSKWVGKMIRFSKVKMIVKGEMKMVLYSEPVVETPIKEERVA